MKIEYFLELVMDDMSPAGGFRTLVIMDHDANCIEFLTSVESYRAEQVNSRLIVYHGRESGQIIGARVEGPFRFATIDHRPQPGVDDAASTSPRRGE